MDLQTHKITDNERKTLGVTALADQPEMPAQNLKEHFDALTNKVADKFNATVDDLQHIENDYEQWDMDEQGRKTAETSRVNAENMRAEAETTRVSAEDVRAAAEAARVTAETTRVSAEDVRAAAEAARSVEETARVAAEATRVAAEEMRETAETTRSAGETARNVWEAYDPTKNYVPGNKVSFQGSSYVNILPCRGIQPADTRYWLLIAQRGQDGDGVGDMLMHVYDPAGIKQDIFAYATDTAAGTAAGTAASTVAAHNSDVGAHPDIRDRIAHNLENGYQMLEMNSINIDDVYNFNYVVGISVEGHGTIPQTWVTVQNLYTGHFVAQTAIKCYSADLPATPRVWCRQRYINGGWSAWAEVLTTSQSLYVTGTYVGNYDPDSTPPILRQDINLGFRPSAVLVESSKGTRNVNYTWGGLALDGHDLGNVDRGSGLTITNDGFVVKSGRDGVNSRNQAYYYIAFG